VKFSFNLTKKDPTTKARRGEFRTLHGVVQTPIFMPVGTFATVKTLTPEELHETGAQIILGNTYHLMLRPGPEVFQKFGGIHEFMNWKKPVLTDSGGFQIFSLPNDRVITEDGAKFRSYVDGKVHLLSPESSIHMQNAIGSDIMMVLDWCVPSTSDYHDTKRAMELTHRWALRSLAAHKNSDRQALFAIVQGGVSEDLRKQSALFLTEHGFDGFAIGGLAVGESKEEREIYTDIATGFLPEDKPRYLMGVGTPVDLLEAVKRGVDMFDCIIPTKVAQQGVAYTTIGQENFARGFFKFSDDPIDKNCHCPVCQKYSRGYIHHLTKCKETLGWRLLNIHNLHYYQTLMAQAREAIENGRYESFYRQKINEIGEETYDLVRCKTGAAAVKHVRFNEVMHSVVGPWEEANQLYVEQSGFAKKVLGPATIGEKPLVIYDVGLGAATNAVAALAKYRELRNQGLALRPLRLVSFENDLSSLRLVLQNIKEFPHSQPFEEALTGIYQSGRWQENGVEWLLQLGDFKDKLDEEPLAPEIVFWDPFSPKNNPDMWALEIFKRLREKIREASDLSQADEARCDLYTYSVSTPVRTGMFLAGFYVGLGKGTGQKKDTTQASTHFESLTHPLHPNWLEKWSRSSVQLPFGFGAPSSDFVAQVKRDLFNHGQWRAVPEPHWTIPPHLLDDVAR